MTNKHSLPFRILNANGTPNNSLVKDNVVFKNADTNAVIEYSSLVLVNAAGNYVAEGISGYQLAIMEISGVVQEWFGKQWLGNPDDPNGYGNMLPKSGGSMSGSIEMNSNPITGLPNPSTDSQPATRGFSNNAYLKKAVGESDTVLSSVSFGDTEHTTIPLVYGTPSDALHATNKTYADSKIPIAGDATIEDQKTFELPPKLEEAPSHALHAVNSQHLESRLTQKLPFSKIAIKLSTADTEAVYNVWQKDVAGTIVVSHSGTTGVYNILSSAAAFLKTSTGSYSLVIASILDGSDSELFHFQIFHYNTSTLQLRVYDKSGVLTDNNLTDVSIMLCIYPDPST